MDRHVDVRRVVRWLVAVVMVTGCAGATGGADVIPTVPETAVPPPPPQLDQPVEAETDAAPSPTPAATPSPAADGSGTAEATTPAADPPDPEALGREIGVAGMVQLLAEDPELAGDRGPDLLQELERIAEGRGRVDRRIEELFERIPRWVDDGELDPQIATASLAALEVASAEVPRGDDDDDDDDD